MNQNDRPGEQMAIVIPFPGVAVSAKTSAAGATPADNEPESTEKQARRAENVSMHALTGKSMSIREMEKLLRTRELSETVVAAEIQRLESCGLLDDFAFAEELTERLQRRKGLGIGAIKAELVKHLILPAAIEQATQNLDTDQVALATEEAKKRFSRMGSLEHDVAYRRLHGYLARRGFRGHEISAALKEVVVKSI